MYVIYEINGIIKSCKVLCCDFVNRHIEKLLTRAVAFKDIWGDLYSTFLSFLPCQQEHTGEGSQIQPETQQAVCLPVHR